MISLTIAAALALLNTLPDKPTMTRPLTSAAYRPIDAHEFDRLKSGVPAASITIDLPLRGCVRMDLVRTQLVTDDFALEIAHIEHVSRDHVSGGKLNPGATTARVSSQRIEPILPLAYTGTIATEPDARVYLGFGIGDGEGLIAGVIEIADQSWWISSGSATARRSGLPAMIAHESALAGQPLDGVHCAAMDLRENQENGDHGNGSGADPNFDGGIDGGVAGGAGCREFRLAVDTDTEFTMSAHGGNTVAAAQYALLLLGAASQVYARDIDARLPVAYLRLWTGEDPWNQAGMIDQLTEYQSYWNANMNGVSRDLGHYLAGRGLGGGVAWLSVACANQQYGYGLSSGIGYGFPYPLIDHDYGNWEPMVVCHEIGHNFGAPHTHDQSPPADGCGANDCTLAYTGTIMSYCHGCDGGMSNVSLHFHPYSVSAMASHLANVACADAGAFSVDDAIATLEGVVVSIDPLANDAFVNCSPLTLSSVDASSVAGGVVTIVAGSPGNPALLQYTPPTGFSGSDNFNYKALDPNGAVSRATVFVEVEPILQQIYLDIVTPGVAAAWFALVGDTAVLPDFTAISSYGGAVLANIDIASTGGVFSTSGRADQVAAVFEGYIAVPTTGLWTFSTESDDGSRILIDDRIVVVNDGLHGMVDRSGQIALEAGYHRYRLEFFENFGGAGQISRWQGPNTPRQVMPAAAFVRSNTVMHIDLNNDGTVGAVDLAVLLSAWGPVAAGAPADFDRNGSVGASDLARLLAYWGS